MSETKHSQEPWAWDQKDPAGRINDSLGQICAEAWAGSSLTNKEQDANARRIVACVNACSGIPTEALEAGALRLAIGALDYVAQAPGFARMRDARVECRSALRALGRLK